MVGGMIALHNSLNAPYGARRFLTSQQQATNRARRRLNAPYGARCFLTHNSGLVQVPALSCLNAPYGARCFLTGTVVTTPWVQKRVLMHLMALGAF